MLNIVLGEDTVNSRKYFQDLKNSYKKKGFEVKDILPNDIDELGKWLYVSPTLFASKLVFFADGLIKYLRKNIKTSTTDDLIKLSKKPDIEIYSWENVTLRGLKGKSNLNNLLKNSKIKEFKPRENIFKLLDNCYPSNKLQFIKYLNKIADDNDENFIFIMLARLIRNLILVNEGLLPPGVQTWQYKKLEFQAKFWKKERLIAFYEALFRIETRLKTGKDAMSIDNSLDILACYYL